MPETPAQHLAAKFIETANRLAPDYSYEKPQIKPELVAAVFEELLAGGEIQRPEEEKQ